MTLVEFFEKDAAENVCSFFSISPKRIIFIGDNLKQMKKHSERYKTVFQARKMEVDIICRSTNRNNIESIINTLSLIVEEYDDCIFDLTGGEDLYLVAAGVVSERYKDKNIQMHRFNIKNNTVIDVDRDGKNVLLESAPALSVEENIRIYGGDIIYDEIEKGKTLKWDMSREFRDDINKMWDICRVSPGEWNAQIGVFSMAKKMCGKINDDLKMTVPVTELKNELKNDNKKCVKIKRIIGQLEQNGLIKFFECNDDTLSVEFKNIQVMCCLTVEGQVLEMKVFLSALEAEQDGLPVYNDVINGVHIDWDGDIHTKQEEYDTENEIDVIMMHGMVPVFVSCKNGKEIDISELYKLNAVATRFGGKYAKRILIATSLDNSFNSNILRQRAHDMGISLIEGYSHNGFKKDFIKMSDDEINKVIGNLWERSG